MRLQHPNRTLGNSRKQRSDGRRPILTTVYTKSELIKPPCTVPAKVEIFTLSSVDIFLLFFAYNGRHGNLERPAPGVHVLHGQAGLVLPVLEVRLKDSPAKEAALQIRGEDHRVGSARRRLQRSREPTDAGPGH